MRWAVTAIATLYVAQALAIAVRSPGESGAFWDEQYNSRVVRRYLDGGFGPPQNHWYSPLSWAPQLAVLKLVDRLAVQSQEKSLAVRHPQTRRLTRLGIVLCRSVNIAYAVVALLLLHHLGTTVASPAVGLWSALVFAGSPSAIRGVVEFKPDSLLLMTTLLTVVWVLPLVRADDPRDFARAGIASGFAAAAKLNGVLVAPTVALAILAGGLTRKRLMRSLVALALAAVVFVATQPWLIEALSYWHRIQDHYLHSVGATSRGEVLVRPWRAMLETASLGPILGGIALAGLAWLAARSVRSWREGSGGRALAVVVSYPIAYVLGVAALTKYPKANLWLQVLPFSALAAGWAIHTLIDQGSAAAARSVRRSRRALATRILRWSSGAVFAALALLPGLSYTYDRAAPRTAMALAQTARKLVRSHHLVATVDRTGGALPRIGGRSKLHRRNPVVVFDSMESATQGVDPTLDLFDVELFAPRRLAADERVALERRLRTLSPESVHRFEPAWYMPYDEPWILVVEPWSREGPPRCVPIEAGRRVGLDRAEPARHVVFASVSLEIGFPYRGAIPQLYLADRELDLFEAGDQGDGTTGVKLFRSVRFGWRDEALAVDPPPQNVGVSARACVQLWSPRRGAFR